MKTPAADFTSVLYLGLAHPSAELRPWSRLTTGAPAAFAVPAESRAVARRLASRTGAEAATLGTSTLHLFWDLFGQIARRRARILPDAALYAVGRWGIERAQAAGRPVEPFAHQDPEALAALLHRGTATPVVVTDGLCTGCGRVAPIEDYLARVEKLGGWLVLDDSQALGLLGREPSRARPYGRGGGGTPSFRGALSPRLITVSTLAKAWGAPLAVLAGSRAAVRRFERESETRSHSSPPSMASLRAAEHALALDDERGDLLRRRLLENVRRFRRGARAAGLTPLGGPFPIQSLVPPPGVSLAEVHRRLGKAGVHAVLLRPRCRERPVLTFVLRADHPPEAIDFATEALARAVGPSL